MQALCSPCPGVGFAGTYMPYSLLQLPTAQQQGRERTPGTAAGWARAPLPCRQGARLPAVHMSRPDQARCSPPFTMSPPTHQRACKPRILTFFPAQGQCHNTFTSADCRLGVPAFKSASAFVFIACPSAARSTDCRSCRTANSPSLVSCAIWGHHNLKKACRAPGNPGEAQV